MSLSTTCLEGTFWDRDKFGDKTKDKDKNKVQNFSSY